MKFKLYFPLLVLINLFFIIPIISAQLGIPHQFWGAVTYNTQRLTCECMTETELFVMLLITTYLILIVVVTNERS